MEIYDLISPSPTAMTANAFRKLSAMMTQITSDPPRENDYFTHMSRKLAARERVEDLAEAAPTVTFNVSEKYQTLESLQYEDINKERISFVKNIHPRDGFLQEELNKARVLIGRGPVKTGKCVCSNGCLFLSNDVLIVSEALKRNRRYWNEVVFVFDDPSFSLTRDGENITLKTRQNETKVTFERLSEAEIWESYINHTSSKIKKITS